jgi:CRISPR-associated endonuclease/helicase Cas3
MAKMNMLNWKDGYAAGQGRDSDVRTPTRLTEESVTFRLARWQNGVLTPWYQAKPESLAWALSGVSLAAWRASGVPEPDGRLAAAMAAAKAGWGRWDAEMPMLLLTPDADAWQGAVIDKNGTKRRAVYDPLSGLTVTVLQWIVTRRILCQKTG